LKGTLGDGGCCGQNTEKSGSISFLKKRTKKLLHGCRRVVRGSRAEVFASFFKKKRFLPKW
jgi:hypothetical protein